MSAYHSLLMVYYHYTTSGHQCQIIEGYGARRWSRTITARILSSVPLPIGLYELAGHAGFEPAPKVLETLKLPIH